MRRIAIILLCMGFIIILAGCGGKKHTVAFDSAGGTPVDAVQVKDNQTITPLSPTRVGYAFAGWFIGTGLDAVEFTSSTKVTSDMILFARWTVLSYIITFESNGGSDVSLRIFDYGETIELPQAPVRTGHDFVGWFIDQDLTTPFAMTTMPAENLILYAKWEEAAPPEPG